MRIISATDYGTRLVLRVAENPLDAEWVHTVGDVERGADGLPVVDHLGHPVLVTAAACTDGGVGATCHNCHYNWRVHEVIFDGDDRYALGDDGQLRAKTVTELSAEVHERLPTLFPPQERPEFLGLEV